MAKFLIAGESVTVEWTREARANLQVRASKLGIDPQRLLQNFADPSKAEYAVCAFIWLLLPREIYKKYELPEDLYPAIDPEKAEETMAAVGEILESISPGDEKKST